MLRGPQRRVALALLALAWLPSCTCARSPEHTLYACGPGFTCPAGQRCEAVRGVCLPNAATTGYVLEGAFAAAPPCDARRAGAIYFDPTLRQFQGCDGTQYVAPPGTVIFYDGSACPTGWSELQEARGRYLVGLQPAQPAGQHTHAGGTDVQGDHVHGWNPGIGAVFATGGTGNFSWATVATPGWGITNMLNAGSHSHNVSVNVPAGSVPGTPAPYLALLVCRKD